MSTQRTFAVKKLESTSVTNTMKGGALHIKSVDFNINHVSLLLLGP